MIPPDTLRALAHGIISDGGSAPGVAITGILSLPDEPRLVVVVFTRPPLDEPVPANHHRLVALLREAGYAIDDDETCEAEGGWLVVIRELGTDAEEDRQIVARIAKQVGYFVGMATGPPNYSG